MKTLSFDIVKLSVCAVVIGILMFFRFVFLACVHFWILKGEIGVHGGTGHCREASSGVSNKTCCIGGATIEEWYVLVYHDFLCIL